MKTNTLKFIIAAVVASSAGLVIAVNLTANLPLLTVVIGYAAVAMLVAVAAVDYRMGSTNYRLR